ATLQLRRRRAKVGERSSFARGPDHHRELAAPLQHDQAARLTRIQAASTGGVHARLRRVAGCVTPTGSLIVAGFGDGTSTIGSINGNAAKAFSGAAVGIVDPHPRGPSWERVEMPPPGRGPRCRSF